MYVLTIYTRIMYSSCSAAFIKSKNEIEKKKLQKMEKYKNGFHSKASLFTNRTYSLYTFYGTYRREKENCLIRVSLKTVVRANRKGKKI